MAKKIELSFKPKSKIGGESTTTKNIGFASFSKDELENLKQKMQSDSILPSEIIADDNISLVLPTQDYSIKKISRSILKPAPIDWNFFSKPNKAKMSQLVESIYKNGLLQPIVVRELDSEGNALQILSGHTRNEAYDILYKMFNDSKYLEIEAIVFPYGVLNDDDAETVVIDTNFMQRGNLPPREMAKCVHAKARKLKNIVGRGDGGIAERIAEEFKIKKTSVFMWKKLANLTDKMSDLIESRKITLRNAYKIASLPTEQQDYLYDNCYHYLSNESIRNIKGTMTLKEIVDAIEKDYGVSVHSVRYEVPETFLRNHKDKPMLVYVPQEKEKEFIDTINELGAYIYK